MEDLKALMEQQPIMQVNQTIQQFVHSADGYDNKLKLTFVLLNMLQEGIQLLLSTDSEEFLSKVRKRIAELDKQSKGLADVYHMQLLLALLVTMQHRQSSISTINLFLYTFYPFSLPLLNIIIQKMVIIVNQ